MSPSFSSARPMWVLSFPAFAIILSFLWYRKKRGSLKTITEGAGETPDDQNSAGFDKEVTVQDKNTLLVQTEENKEVEEEIEEVHKLILEKSVLVVDETEAALTKDLIAVKEEELKKDCEKELNVAEIKAIEESIILTSQDEEKANQPVEEAKPFQTEEVDTAKEPSMTPKLEETVKDKAKSGKKKKTKEMAKKSTNDSATDKRQKKDENTACLLEKKLAKLDLASQCSETVAEEKPTNEDVTERDSANNSPSEVMLASPSVSGYSDTHSEVSIELFFFVEIDKVVLFFLNKIFVVKRQNTDKA